MKRFVLAMMMSSVTMVGCVADSDGDSGNDDTGDVAAAAFVGTWVGVAGSGVNASSCNGQPEHAEALTTDDRIVVAVGTDSDLVVNQDPECQLKLQISGRIATAVPGQSCAKDGLTVTFTRFVLTLSTDGQNMSGDAALTMMSGFGSCTGSLTGTFTK
jgi:hypothetical protein